MFNMCFHSHDWPNLFSWVHTLAESKLVLSVTVVMYFILTSMVAAHALFVEKDRIMMGYLAGDKVCGGGAYQLCV